MKKLLIILLFICLSTNLTYARDEDLGFRGPLNYIQSKILEHVLSIEVQKITSGDIRIQIVSYGAKALRNGIFKSVIMEGKNLNFDGMSISKIYAQTITENNRLDIRNIEHIKILTHILAEYSLELNNDDIKTILASEAYKAEISKINNKMSPIFRISNVDIYCEYNRLFIKLLVKSDLIGASFNVRISTDIYSDGYKTGLYNIKFNKKLKMGLSDDILYIIDRLNPVNYVVKDLGNANVKVSIKQVNIVDDKIQISGIIKVYKDK